MSNLSRYYQKAAWDDGTLDRYHSHRCEILRVKLPSTDTNDVR